MTDLKAWMWRVLCPPLWVFFPLILVSGGGLAAVFLLGYDTHPIGYAVFALSAYTLTAAVFRCIRKLPAFLRGTRARLDRMPVVGRYMTDDAYKVRISLAGNLLYNAAFAAFYLVSGSVNRSYWLGGLGIYYLLLSILRFPLLRYTHRMDTPDRLKEYKLYRNTGIGMLPLNCALSLIFGLMLLRDETYSYPGLMIFAVAAFTFSSLTVAIVHVIRYRKYKNPVLSASRAVQFTVALVSMMTLETAMLEAFSEGNVVFDDTMKTLTAIGVYLMALSLSIAMIIRGAKGVRRIKKERDTAAKALSIQSK